MKGSKRRNSSILICALSVIVLLSGCQENTVKTPYHNAYNKDIGAYAPKQYSHAYNYFYSRAIQGDAAAENNLGHMYMDGRGIKQDSTKAIYWYTQAANQGYRAAQVNLGVAYLYGRGTLKDKQKACHWLLLAKRKGSKTATDYYRRKC